MRPIFKFYTMHRDALNRIIHEESAAYFTVEDVFNAVRVRHEDAVVMRITGNHERPIASYSSRHGLRKYFCGVTNQELHEWPTEFAKSQFSNRSSERDEMLSDHSSVSIAPTHRRNINLGASLKGLISRRL